MTDITYPTNIQDVLMYMVDKLKQYGYYLNGTYNHKLCMLEYELHKDGADVFVKGNLSYTTLKRAAEECGMTFVDSLIDQMIVEFECGYCPPYQTQFT